MNLGRCQRYFQNVQTGAGLGANSISVFIVPQFFTKMRSTPTVGLTGVFNINDGANNLTQSSTDITLLHGNDSGCFTQLGNFTSIVTSRVCLPRFQNNNKITLSAEL